MANFTHDRLQKHPDLRDKEANIWYERNTSPILIFWSIHENFFRIFGAQGFFPWPNLVKNGRLPVNFWVKLSKTLKFKNVCWVNVPTYPKFGWAGLKGLPSKKS